MYTGLTGKVTVVDNGAVKPIAYISNWSVEDTTDIIEITELGVDSKKKKAGLQSWSASADGTVSFDGTNQNLLFEAKHGRKPVTVQLYLLDKTKVTPNAAKDLYFEGTGYIESLSVDLSAEDKGNISISISGSGELELLEENKNLFTGKTKA